MKYAEALKTYGTKAAASRALGIFPNNFARGLRAEQRRNNGRSADNVLAFPEIPSRKEPVDKLLARRVEHFERQKAHYAAATWQQVKVDSKQPIAVAFMGDPHIDDDGCDLPALLDDISILKRTRGMYAVNIGDTTNNWVGRLARLFGGQETSQTSARQMAAWLLTGAGINWLAVLLGNHDEWNEGGEIIKLMCSTANVEIPVHEWQAKIELVFSNGATCRINAAHDFKGRSIYNAAHGLKREAIWYQDGAHIYAAGHIHFGEIGQCELPGGHNPWLLRVRGYKHFDSHALVNGYHEGKRFRSVVAIIDPNAPEEHRVTVYGSIAQAAAVLEAMRAKCVPKKSVAKSSKGRRHGESLPAVGREQSRTALRGSSGRPRPPRKDSKTKRGKANAGNRSLRSGRGGKKHRR